MTIDKINYDKSMRDAYRENLLTLLDSLFIDADPPMLPCLSPASPAILHCASRPYKLWSTRRAFYADSEPEMI